MLKTLFYSFIINLIALNSFSQEITYFHKIEKITADTKLASLLYKRLDSVKQTRRPNDSKVKVFFDRDIDFGFRHQRITVTFNGIYYQVNLLVKSDSIYFSSVLFDNDFYGDVYSKFNAIKIDTNNCLQYLKLRNGFYKSSKKLTDIKEDLNSNEVYAFYCGDGNPKTAKGKYIENLVKNKKINKLNELVSSLSCEEQAYGEAGFIMLQKGGYKISPEIKKIIGYIKTRNSYLATCEGCLSPIVRREYDIQ